MITVSKPTYLTSFLSFIFRSSKTSRCFRCSYYSMSYVWFPPHIALFFTSDVVRQTSWRKKLFSYLGYELCTTINCLQPEAGTDEKFHSSSRMQNFSLYYPDCKISYVRIGCPEKHLFDRGHLHLSLEVNTCNAISSNVTVYRKELCKSTGNSFLLQMNYLIYQNNIIINILISQTVLLL